MEKRSSNIIDIAEDILQDYDCRIHTFLLGGRTQYVVRHKWRAVSMSFTSIATLCQWVVENTEELHRNINYEE